MNRLSSAQDDLIAAYVSRTAPVQWVSWLYEVDDQETQRELRTILFDASDRLRDLEAVGIRDDVLRCIQRHASIKTLVLKEAKQFLEHVAEQVIRPKEEGTGTGSCEKNN